MRSLYLESVAGIAGDMFAAAFVDAGIVTAEELAEVPRKLGLDGVYVEVTRQLRARMLTSHINVTWQNESWKQIVDAQHEHGYADIKANGQAHAHAAKGAEGKPAPAHWHTHYLNIDRLLERSKLDQGTIKFARAVFHELGQAEAAAHGLALEDVVFHEVGAVDSIVDVAMAALCVGKVGVTRFLSSPIKLGRGHVVIDHGTHPVPPPGAARLVLGMPVSRVPDAVTRENVELSTPTGLAILKALKPEFVNEIPDGRILAQGMGSGTMDLGAFPNVFRIFLLDSTKHHVELPYERDIVVEIACNVDDQSSERTAWVVEALLGRGALDAWVTPISGKKGRRAMQLSVLADASSWKELADWILRHTTTFGLRYLHWERLKLSRRIEQRDTPGGPVRYKVGATTDGKVLKEKPEYEDLRRIWEQDPDFKPEPR